MRTSLRTRRLVRPRGRTVLATALVTLALTAPAVAANMRAVEHGWHTWPLGAQRDNQELRAVAALGPNDVWAVGYNGEMAGGPPLVQHFDGFAWRDVSVPVSSVNGQFDAVAPLAADDVWALGHWNDAPAFNDRAMAVHFDGTAWHETTLPKEPADISAYPFGAAAIGPDDVWAVGALAKDRIANPHPLAYHWDGTQWTSAATPDTGGDAILFAAAADRSGGAWAVGVAYTEGKGRPLVERWDGIAWHLVDVPFDPAQAHSLEGVAVLAPDDAWAVGGMSTDSGESRPVAYHWDGRAWSSVPLPAINADLHGVSADPTTGTVWAAGTRPDETTPAVLFRWDGTAWTQVPVAEDPDARGGSLFSVAAVPNANPSTPSAWAVGSTLPTFQQPWHAVIEGYGPAPDRVAADRGPSVGPPP